ncbi:DUF4287 domain-containing protein [Occultella glacieicola]|uniref:DUF4287 domain-containing protein n=1 Tax=Occultella glacieicola TaxID=2518684 RepID=A0ABY2DYU5_9MICO|nr:DUF4287 domain-containing protein [Occultella glacieicola]TDE89656.1 DUF4287 domain-containing protein [Occultella glacieicola]
MTDWVAQPGHDDDLVRSNTGHGWDEWVRLLDAGPGRAAGHTEQARWVREEHGVDGWWAQSVVVGYERIVGIRLPGQMPDGTFTVSRSRILDMDADTWRARLLDDATRAALFEPLGTTLRSKPEARSLRFDLADGDTSLGVVAVALDPLAERVRLTITHEKLADPGAAERWKDHWSAWIGGLGTEQSS